MTCLAQAGPATAPLERLERMAALARELAFVHQELEAELARAACQGRSGQAGAARELLEGVARRARAAGFAALAAEGDEQRGALPPR